MSDAHDDTIDDDDYGLQGDPAPPTDATEEARKESRRKAAEAKRQAETDTLRRENALLRAGVDTDSALGKLLVDSYKGDLSSEAIKAYVTGLGMAPAKAEPAFTPEEQESTDVRSQVATGIEPDLDVAPDPVGTGLRGFQEHLSQGETRVSASKQYWDSIMEAAAKGDPRVVISDPRR